MEMNLHVHARRLTAHAALVALSGALWSLLTPGIASAAVFGPDTFGYSADTGAAFTYEDISGTGTQVLSNDDDSAVQIPIGFTFSFYDVPYTNVWVSSNALVTFDSGNTTFGNQDLTSSSNPSQPAIAPLWDDWVTYESAFDAVFYQTLGTPGVDQRLIVQWHVVSHCCGTSTGTVDFEMVLFETGAIEFRYQDVDGMGCCNNGSDATVGIRAAEGNATADGNVLQISLNSPSISNGQAIRITAGPPPPRDFGDAPSPYPTTLADNGARHNLSNSGPYLGTFSPDDELDGQPSVNAVGDDNNGIDDEDGVGPIILEIGETIHSVQVTVSRAPGFLDGWLDFNGDGTWDTGTEKIFDSVFVGVGTTTLSFAVPPGTVIPNGMTYARFRISSAGNLAPTGVAPDGEVEDYLVGQLPPGSNSGNGGNPGGNGGTGGAPELPATHGGAFPLSTLGGLFATLLWRRRRRA